jgi:hypothetical protein
MYDDVMAPLAPLRDSQVRWIWLSKPLSFKWQAHWNTPDPPGAALLFHLFSCFAWFAYEGGRRRDPFSGTCKPSDHTLRRATSACPGCVIVPVLLGLPAGVHSSGGGRAQSFAIASLTRLTRGVNVTFHQRWISCRHLWLPVIPSSA